MEDDGFDYSRLADPWRGAPIGQSVCRVYWGSDGCDLERGHRGPHRSVNGEVTAETAFLFGEDLTDDERRTVEQVW